MSNEMDSQYGENSGDLSTNNVSQSQTGNNNQNNLDGSIPEKESEGPPVVPKTSYRIVNGVLELDYSQIIQQQATLNLITAGSVSHGKSTLVRAMTGVKTQKFQSELERNCTIYLGYANGKIFRCPKTGYQCVVPSTKDSVKHPETGEDLVLIKHFSVVDCPGHECLMATMISGTQNVDVGFLVIAANDPVFPEPQTYEHLLALSVPQEDGGLQQFLVLQNKLDLITQEAAYENKEKITGFLAGSPADCSKTPLIPVSAQKKENMSVITDYLISEVKEPEKNYNRPARLTVIRSFDVNKGERPVSELMGGIAGGSLKCGVLRVGDWVEIRPGITRRDPTRGWVSHPLISRVKSIQSERTKMDIAISGGLLGIGLDLDPSLTKKNGLVGQVLGHLGTLPDVYEMVQVKYKTLNRMREKMGKIKQGEKMQACIHSKVIMALVEEADSKKKTIWIRLATPVCFEKTDRISFLRISDNKWSMDGYGQVIDMKKIEVALPLDYYEWKKEQEDRSISEVKINYDLPEMSGVKTGLDFFDYNVLAKDVNFKDRAKSDDLKLPHAKVSYQNRKSVFSNFAQCARAVDFRPNIWAGTKQGSGDEDDNPIAEEQDIFRELDITTRNLIEVSDHLFKFLSDELLAPCSLNESRQMIIGGKFGSSQVNRIFTNYTQKYVKCHNHGCSGQKTFMYRKNRLVYQYCYHCHSSHSLKL